MNNKEILDQQIKAFKSKYPLTIGWRLRRHKKIVLEHLYDGENIEYAFFAQKNNNPLDITSSGVIAITNKRLIVGRDRVVIGYFFDSITPELFNDIKVKSGIIWGKLEIDTVKEFLVLSNIQKKALVEIEREVGSRMMTMREKLSINCSDIKESC
mgnify:FL=1